MPKSGMTIDEMTTLTTMTTFFRFLRGGRKKSLDFDGGLFSMSKGVKKTL
ncbi:MAG: hypothetical protein LBC63_04170 [Holophagales bacterium]|jgi:hypothetical protein|nr:hypothetical protein [Holophagales bacterium]